MDLNECSAIIYMQWFKAVCHGLVIARYGCCMMRLPIFVSSLFAAPVAAQVTFHEPAGKELLPAEVEIEKLGGGMEFVEGPVWVAGFRLPILEKAAKTYGLGVRTRSVEGG